MSTPVNDDVQLLLDVRGLRKSYGAVHALRGADFELRSGEVMALLGENGTGKSTLVKTLGGLQTRDAGTIRIDGRDVDVTTPAKSREAGIAVVTQELSLIPGLTAAENVFLGSGLRGPWNQGRLQRLARPHLEEVGLSAARRRVPVRELSVAERQLIEIARVLGRDARVLIFDEPTAALSDVEIERVLQLVRDLVRDGRGAVYVTHRLGEVFALADRATIMRDGASQPPVNTADVDIDGVIQRMLGRSLTTMFPARAESFGPPTLELRGVRTAGVLDPLDLTVRRGEIVGLAGQIGSGAEQVLQAIAGVAPDGHTGEIVLDGEPIAARNIRETTAAGIAYCSADRKRDGIFERRSVRDNLTAPALDDVTPLGWYSPGRADRLASELADKFQIAAGKTHTAVGALSGGNQQKVALGKWMAIRPRVLMVAEPTRGVDIGARAEIYTHLRQLAAEGLTIVFVSSDLPEVLGVADTVLTFYRGRLVRRVAASGLREEDLMADVTHGPREVAA